MSSNKIINDTHWHALRLRNVGASESAALFNLLPWKTPWTLHMEKAGKLPPDDISEVKHIKQGKHFEPAIAGWAAEKFGITLNKVHVYDVADDCPGMGASRDYVQVGTGERIDTEIKWVLRRDDSWAYEGDLITHVPDYYAIQMQHQLACSGNNKCRIIAFIDNDVRTAVYERREKMIENIKAAIRRFWLDIENKAEPPIDFKADAEAVMRYASFMPVRQIEWDKDVETLVVKANVNAKIAKKADELAAAAKAEITNMMIERATKAGMNDVDTKITCQGGDAGDGRRYNITNYYVAENAGKEITADMLGDRLYAKKAYRVCLITTPKPKAEKKGKQKDAAE